MPISAWKKHTTTKGTVSYENLATGEIISRRQYDKLKGINYAAAAKERKLAAAGLAKAVQKMTKKSFEACKRIANEIMRVRSEKSLQKIVMKYGLVSVKFVKFLLSLIQEGMKRYDDLSEVYKELLSRFLKDPVKNAETGEKPLVVMIQNQKEYDGILKDLASR